MILYEQEEFPSSKESQRMDKKESGVSVSAVKRTMAVLELLSDGSSYSVTEIASTIGFHKSTVYRFLTTLASLGYVSQDPQSERYTLTDKLITSLLAHPLKPTLIHASGAIMDDLAKETEETIHLALLDGDHLTYIHKIESTRTLRVAVMSSSIGSEAPLYCTSLGKVMLAWHTEDFINSYLKKTKLTPHTKNTITTEERFLAELVSIREKGFGLDDEEHEEGVTCIGAPVFNREGNAVAAISISAPSVRMDEQQIELLSVRIQKSAREISKNLGYSPDQI